MAGASSIPAAGWRDAVTGSTLYRVNDPSCKHSAAKMHELQPDRRHPLFRRPLGALVMATAIVIVSGCRSGTDEDPIVTAEVPDAFADFVEPDFPFITTTIDARSLHPALPDDNAVPRGVVVMLGDSAYAAFDPDLLRMSVAWSGEFLAMTTMAQISYQDSLNKDNQIPTVLGEPIAATGLYPGWSAGEVAASGRDYPGLYGGYLHPWFLNGDRIYWLMSQWDPYNVFLMRTILEY